MKTENDVLLKNSIEFESGILLKWKFHQRSLRFELINTNETDNGILNQFILSIQSDSMQCRLVYL